LKKLSSLSSEEFASIVERVESGAISIEDVIGMFEEASEESKEADKSSDDSRPESAWSSPPWTEQEVSLLAKAFAKFPGGTPE